MTRLPSGVMPIAHTPFEANGEIDEASLRREIDWCYECGASGFCTGMVSEILRLTTAERLFLTETLADLNGGRGVFVASVGAENTKQAVEFARQAEKVGADTLMAIPPTTTALPDSALVAYYTAIIESVELPLIIQDASSYVGRPIPIPLCVELLDRYGDDRILFKPEAAPFGPHLSALRDASSGRARIFEGSGGILLIDSFRRGVRGTMPGMEMLDGIVKLWRALEAGDEAAAYRLHFPICALVALQMQAGLDGFLAVEKQLLVKRGIFATDVRRPPYAWELDDETAAEVDRLFELFEQAVA